MVRQSSNCERLRYLPQLVSPIGNIRSIEEISELPILKMERRRLAPQPRQYERLLDAIISLNLDSGSTLSFHHHFRNGDKVLEAVLDCASSIGLRDLSIAPSSIFPNQSKLVEHIKSGVVTNIVTDYMAGPVADAVIKGQLKGMVLFQSHGGRARAISSGELKIDAAFIGASVVDGSGAATGRGGSIPCGPLGYAMVDAAYANKTIVLAHEITDAPLRHPDIPGEQVDIVVPFENPGLPAGISFGSTVPMKTPISDLIAKLTVDVIKAAGLLTKGFSFQTGAGGYSLAAVPHIGKAMSEANIVGDFVSGGITGAHIEIVSKRQSKAIFDVQCFDQVAVQSSLENDWHKPMSASKYASPICPGSITKQLSVMVLGAAEVDEDFNINVVVGGNGKIIGGPGGHPDTASGAKLTIVTTRLVGGGYAKIVKKVRCICTPGTDVDVLVTDHGVAVNPENDALKAKLKAAGVKTVSIAELREIAERQATMNSSPFSGKPCALVESPDGRIIDVILGE